MDKAFLLARNVVDTSYERLGSDVREATKKVILDTLSTAVGGSAAPGTRGSLKILLYRNRSLLYPWLCTPLS